MKRSSVLAAAVLALSAVPLLAGTEEKAGKEVAAQAEKEPFPVHFFLRAGFDSNYVFRGVNLLPEKTLNLPKAANIALDQVPNAAGLLAPLGLTPESLVDAVGFPKRLKVARESGIGYFDASVSYNLLGFNLTGGAFYALQTSPRTLPNFFANQSFFTEYKEIDGFFNASKAIGPVTVSLGGTYYHVEKNSIFDTAELNFGVSYTPPQFQYITASFSYDYAGSTNYDPAKGSGGDDYYDGHHLEARLDGNIPVPLPSPVKDYLNVSFNPYVLVSAGSGIIPRSFSVGTLPTYFNDRIFAAALTPVFNGILNGQNGASANAISQAFFSPDLLDRDFDLSNFQTGFKLRINFAKYFTLTGDAAYSRPLGNLQEYPYNQKDVIYGGASLTFYF